MHDVISIKYLRCYRGCASLAAPLDDDGGRPATSDASPSGTPAVPCGADTGVVDYRVTRGAVLCHTDAGVPAARGPGSEVLTSLDGELVWVLAQGPSDASAPLDASS